NVQEYIQVDGHSSKLIFDFFSANRPDLTLLDSDAKKVKVQTTPTHSATNWIFVIDTGVKPGLWSLSIDAGEQNKGFCYVSIRTTLDKPVYVAFTRDVASDRGAGTNDAQEYPEQGDSNAVVVQSDHGVLTHVQFFDRTDRTLLWASPLVPRLRCTYNYIAQEIFSCPAASFTVAVDGFDENGHPFRREQHVHCVGRQRKHSLQTLIVTLPEL
ncbi:C-type lectin, partial [Aphelenchoides avenae]